MRRMRAKGLSAKSIRNYVGTLSALFNYAVRKRWAKANPVREVDLPKPPSNDEIRFVTLDEINALADAAVAGPYRALDRAMYLTAAMTGLRVGELIALRWRDVDFVAGRVRVRRNYVLGEFGTPKSRRSSRSVPLDDSLAGELDRLARAAAREQAEPDPDALVFPSPHNGEPLSKGQILRRYRRALKAARLDTTHRFHDLRHTFGTLAAAQGVPMRLLQEWMGHRDIATTQRDADYAPSAHEAAFIGAMFAQRRREVVEPSREVVSAD